MFSTNLLEAQPARYAMIAESVIPPIGIFLAGYWLGPGKNAGSKVNGRPAGAVFGIVWTILVIIWTLSLILVAMNTVDTLSLSLIGVLSLFAVFFCILWLWVYKYESKAAGAQVLLLALACSVSCTIISLASETPSDAKVLISWFFGMISTWLGVASMYNYLEIN